MQEQMVSLAEECARIDELWQRIEDAHAPLPTASAFAFHRLHEHTDGLVPRAAYNADLNLVAAALSRHSSIYTILDDEEGLTSLPVNLRNQRFVNGATELLCMEDGFFFERLLVTRADVEPAISLMKHAGLAFACEFYPVARHRERGG